MTALVPWSCGNCNFAGKLWAWKDKGIDGTALLVTVAPCYRHPEPNSHEMPYFCGEFRPKRLGVPGLSTCKECRFWLPPEENNTMGQCRADKYAGEEYPPADYWCSEFFPRHPEDSE